MGNIRTLTLETFGSNFFPPAASLFFSTGVACRTVGTELSDDNIALEFVHHTLNLFNNYVWNKYIRTK